MHGPADAKRDRLWVQQWLCTTMGSIVPVPWIEASLALRRGLREVVVLPSNWELKNEIVWLQVFHSRMSFVSRHFNTGNTCFSLWCDSPASEGEITMSETLSLAQSSAGLLHVCVHLLPDVSVPWPGYLPRFSVVELENFIYRSKRLQSASILKKRLAIPRKERKVRSEGCSMWPQSLPHAVVCFSPNGYRQQPLSQCRREPCRVKTSCKRKGISST